MKRCIAYVIFTLALSLVSDAATTESYERVSPEIEQEMAQTRANLTQWLREVNSDVFRPGTFLAKDELLLKDGTTITGKILDYGPYVGIVDDTGRRIVPRDTIKKMTASWGDQPPTKPDVPDLDVSYIERLPRYRSNHANVSYDTKEKGVYLTKPNDDPLWPPRGTKATFKAHVVNKGPVESKPFAYEWLIDGKRKARGKHAALKPGEELVVDFSWRWQDGPHTVTFKVIPNGDDFSAWNNAHTDRTDSLGFFMIAAQSTYDSFNNNLNMVESFSFEDWLQYHLQVMNFLFSASVHPGSPLGCFERVRMDEFMVLADEGFNEISYGAKLGYDDEGYVHQEGKWVFSPWDKYDWRAANMDWGLIHELGHQLGLIDYYTLDFWRYASFARDKNGDLIDVGHLYSATDMMRSHGPFAFSEVTAIGMNLERGKHRGFFGDYLFYLPKECGIRILDFSGKPIPGADVRIFRRRVDVLTEDTDQRCIPEDPVFEGATDADGVFMLPNEEPPFVFTTDNGFTRAPSPFGDALVISDTSLMLIEIWKDGRRDVQFTDVTWFVIGRGRGYKDKYTKDIPTILSAGNDTVKPPRIVAINTDGSSDVFKIHWNNVPGNTAVKFTIYQLHDGLPFQRTYMNEIATVNAQGPYAMSVVYLSGWVAMTGVDDAGNESAPSEPTYVGSRSFTRIDADSKGQIFTADGAIQRIDPAGALHPFPARSSRGYWPATALAIGSKDEIIVLSRDIGGVCIFGLDGREITHFGEKGSGDGQLNAPSDIDVDSSGNTYIADTGNNRIAVFGPDGTFIANVGAGALEKPIAVEVDISGNLYAIEEKKPGLRNIPKMDGSYGEPVTLIETKDQPWDVTSDAHGRIYVAVNAEPGLLVLDANGTTLSTLGTWGLDSLRGITGLAIDRRGFLVCSVKERGIIIRPPLTELVPPSPGVKTQ